jgi:dTDP-glucose 4,6-dehydratase
MCAMVNILITGGLGFIGSHLVKFLFSNPSYLKSKLINLDYAGYGSHIKNINDEITSQKNVERYSFIRGDINDVNQFDSITNIDVVINVAAETHVDRSIQTPADFIHSNYNGTFALLEYIRKRDIKRYVQVSTDEVYGESQIGHSFRESDRLYPSNPYSSTKAAADLLVTSYARTYGINASITRCTNNFGSHQFPEKLIPRTIIRILINQPVLLYGDGRQVRDWLYVSDHVRAIELVMRKGKAGQIYNISASNYLANIDLVQKLSGILERKAGKAAKITFIKDRPGHDYRYSLDSDKIRDELGWEPEANFEIALQETVDWYLNNTEWWKDLVNPYVRDQPLEA